MSEQKAPRRRNLLKGAAVAAGAGVAEQVGDDLHILGRAGRGAIGRGGADKGEARRAAEREAGGIGGRLPEAGAANERGAVVETVNDLGHLIGRENLQRVFFKCGEDID